MSNFLETYTTKIKTWANGKFRTEAAMQAYVDYYLPTYPKQPIIDAFVNSLSSETQSAIEDYLATVIVVSISATGVANRGSVASNANVVLTATAENVPEDATPIYTWEKYNGAGYDEVTTDDGSPLGNTLSLNLTAGTHTYRAVVTVNNTNYTTDNFTLTVYQPYTANNVSVTIFAISPSNVNLAEVIEGTDVTFRAFPTPANLTYTYQWYNGVTAISGATSASYDYTAENASTTETHTDKIWCMVIFTNANLSKASNILTATVAPATASPAITNFSLVSKTKNSVTLTWTKANASDNVVIIIKQVQNGDMPNVISDNTFENITAPTVSKPATAPSVALNAGTIMTSLGDYYVVYKGGNIGGSSGTMDNLKITGLASNNHYTAFAFACNSAYTATSNRTETEQKKVTVKTTIY